MKLFDMPPSANCRRVRIFLTEKGVKLPTENCFDGQRFCLTDEYVARYPFRQAPMLELDDGRQIGESTAICRYIEAKFPEPNLFGRGAEEIALVEMWQQRINADGEVAVEEILRNSAPPFADRGLAGSTDPVPQIPALVERGRHRFMRLARTVNHQLESTAYVAGERYSMADISLLCAIDFARYVGMTVPEGFPALARWYDEVRVRPSSSS